MTANLQRGTKAAGILTFQEDTEADLVAGKGVASECLRNRDSSGDQVLGQVREIHG